MRLKKKWLATLILGIVCLTTPGCTSMSQSKTEENTEIISSNPGDHSATRDIFAMDTYMTLTAYGEKADDAVTAAVNEIERIENLLSTGMEGSEIFQLNNSGEIKASDETGFLVERSKELYETTQGAFDITVYPIMEAWGFSSGNYRVPEKEELEDLKTKMGSEYITGEANGMISLEKDGMKIDLGGIAKGYTSSRVMEIFQDYDIESAVINLGGNVQVLNRKTDGTLWRVAVENPENTEEYLGIVQVENKAVITSGGYERYFEEDGNTYHHIIDPATGYPADSGLTSVTIISEDGTLADGLSTSLFILGKEKAIEYWRCYGEDFDAILVDEDGKIYVTEGIADSFSGENVWEKITKKE